MTIARKARIFWPVFLLLFLADCTTKGLAETHLAWSVPESVIGDFFRFTLGYNPGAALGISVGEHSRIFFSLTAAIIVIVLTQIYRRADARSTIVGLSVGLLIGVRWAISTIDCARPEVWWTSSISESETFGSGPSTLLTSGSASGACCWPGICLPFPNPNQHDETARRPDRHCTAWADYITGRPA